MALKRFLRRLANIFRHGRAEDDLAHETAAHLALLEDAYHGRGLSADEARCAARRASAALVALRSE
jgi:hypothetical protein